MASKTIDIYWETKMLLPKMTFFFVSIINTCFFQICRDRCLYLPYLWSLGENHKIWVSTLLFHVWYGEFIHLVNFLWLFSTKLSLLQWCTHNALFLLLSSLPLGIRPFGSKQHTPLIASSCLFYWVIGSIMHCGIYLWARMLCSARWGHSCQQECQQEFLKLGWTCENYIPR